MSMVQLMILWGCNVNVVQQKFKQQNQAEQHVFVFWHPHFGYMRLTLISDQSAAFNPEPMNT